MYVYTIALLWWIGILMIERNFAQPRFDVITLFPKMLNDSLSYGIPSRAVTMGRMWINLWNLRDYSGNRRGSVDDRPYGGGPGMVMRYEPLANCVRRVKAERSDAAPVVYLSPQGGQFDAACAEAIAHSTGAVLVCGRYEGVDERFIDAEVDLELSIGDYVLSGGEPAALVVIDAVARLIPGVLGDPESAVFDSFASGLLDWPQFTRPDTIEGRVVPDVLLSGDHDAIARWRRIEAERRTKQRRADLWQEYFERSVELKS